MNDNILDGLSGLGSPVADNVTVAGSGDVIPQGAPLTYEDIRNTADILGADSSPFGDATTGTNLELNSVFPILYKTDEKDYIQIRSGVAFHYKTDSKAMFSASEDEDYVVIFDGSTRIPKEATEMKIEKKSIVKIGLKGIKTKVDAEMETFFSKLSLSTKMKIGRATEMEETEYDPVMISAAVAKSEVERQQGLVDLAAQLKGGSSTGALGDFLKTYAFKKHVLVTGPAGHGKTYIVDKFSHEYGVRTIFKAFDEGTESIDLLGHMIKLTDGSFKWKDGVLSSAFRKGKTEKVMLFIDEILRAPVKELNILVGSLSPNSQEEYVLRTGRPMEEDMEAGSFLAEEELLTIPMENLFVVATTNQGSGYNTGRIDRALKDRFRLFYQEASREDIEDIVYDKAFKLLKVDTTAKNLTTVLMTIMDEISEMKETGNLPETMSLRHISEVLDTATTARDVKSRMLDIAPNIVSITSDGKFNPTQLQIVTEIIKAKL